MQRRKFLIGLGSLAAGGAAATGSGAFSAMSADRESNINVVSDDTGLVGLKPGIDSDTVKLSDNPGELVIDTSLDGSTGVNTHSVYQFGELGDWYLPGIVSLSEEEDWQETLVVWAGTHWNGDGESQGNGVGLSILEASNDTIELQDQPNMTNSEESTPPLVSNDEYAFHMMNNDSVSHDFTLTLPTGGGWESWPMLEFEDVEPGEYVTVSFMIIAGEETDPERPSGELSVSAE
jgi:hypothetical protein